MQTYTDRGSKSRKVLKKVNRLNRDELTGEYRYTSKMVLRKHWGNFIGYALRASIIMEEPSILRQIRNHKKILKMTLTKRLNE